MLPVEVTDPVFDPQAQAACQAAGGDLREPACAKRAAGQARPTTAGRYTALTHNFAATLSVTFAGPGVW
jgi:hypothetical protein